MATIHQFTPAPPRLAAGERSQSAGCEIILFPGVRYERWEEPAAERKDEPAKRQKKSGRNRAVKSND